jgi:hypothetical protein
MQFFPNNLKGQNIFEIKFSYVTNDTAKTSVKKHINYYTTPRKTVICDSDGVTGQCISHQ